MVHDTTAKAVSSAVLELKRGQDDPQAVLSTLVQLHATLASASSSATLSLPTGPSLAEVAKQLQSLLLRYIRDEEEIVWFVCRVVAVWCGACHRMKHECGQIQLWVALQTTRGAYPESPRVLESSLKATIALFHRIELHQLVGFLDQNHDKITDELLALMDRLDSAPTRFMLLSPHYDCSKIVVLALQALHELFSSSRVAIIAANAHTELFAQKILPRMLKMLPRFFRSEDAMRVWLGMARLQLQYSPAIAFKILFMDSQSLPSWFHRVGNQWRESHGIVYDLSALLTQIFAVPHGSKALPVNVSASEMSHALLIEHGLLQLLLELVDIYSGRLKQSTSEEECALPVVLEISRCIRQWSSIPEFLHLFPSVSAAKESLLPIVTRELETCHNAIRTNGKQSTEAAYMRLQLELLLTLTQLTLSPSFARIIQHTETLQPLITRISKRAAACLVTAKIPSPDSELPAVLAREANSTIRAIASLPPPARTPSSAKRNLQRLPSSSTVSRSPSNSRGVATSSTLRRTPSTTMSLVRVNSQTRT